MASFALLLLLLVAAVSEYGSLASLSGLADLLEIPAMAGTGGPMTPPAVLPDPVFNTSKPVAPTRYAMEICKCAPGSAWTLHGLWPSPAGAVEDTYVAVDPAQEAILMTHWASCDTTIMPHRRLWKHEWNKHGAPYYENQWIYFQLAIALKDHYFGFCDNDTYISAGLSTYHRTCRMKLDGTFTVTDVRVRVQ